MFSFRYQTLRQRTTEAVMRLLSGQKEDAELDAETASMLVDHGNQQIFNPQERRMIERVLNLNQRTVSSIMTSRHDIEHIDFNAPEDEIASYWSEISIRGWWLPTVMMQKICSVLFTLSTCYNSHCVANRSTCGC
ncbi:hypothetical protein ACNKHT_13385 [Shigella flexneri]